MRYALHLAKHVFWNAGTVLFHLGGLDLLRLGPASVLAGVALLLGRRGAPQPWHWCGVFVACACLPYLPTFADQVRYYYLVYPHLLAATFGLALLVADTAGPRRWRIWAGALVTLSYLYGGAVALTQESARSPEHQAVRHARSLAARIQAADLAGPVAGVSRSDKHPAIYTSYLLGTPYHGNEDARAAERLRASGARLLIARRGGEQEGFLLGSPEDAEDLDPILFGGHPPAAEMPFRVFLNRHYAGIPAAAEGR
jgi:hypothetical protein